MMSMLMTGYNEFTAIRVDKHKRIKHEEEYYIDKANEEDTIVEITIDIKENKKVFKKIFKNYNMSKGKEKYLKKCRNRAILYKKRLHKYGKWK